MKKESKRWGTRPLIRLIEFKAQQTLKWVHSENIGVRNEFDDGRIEGKKAEKEER